MEFKTDALLLRAADYGENDKMATLLTAERGKIGAALKGVKKAGAKLKFAAQPFCFAEYVLAEKSGRHTVISASLHDGFFPLREDVGKYYAAAVVCEACDKLMYEEMPGGGLLVAAVTALTEMCGEETAFPLVKFLLTALRLAGYPIRAELSVGDAEALAVPERESTREAGEMVLGEPLSLGSRLDSSPNGGAEALAVSESENSTHSPAPTRGGGVGGWSGDVLLNSPVGCEDRRDRRRGTADGVLAVPAAKTGRGVDALFFDMEHGAFSLEKGTPASAVTYFCIREALGFEAPPRTRDGEKRALRLLYSYFAYQTDSELTSLPEYVRML